MGKHRASGVNWRCWFWFRRFFLALFRVSGVVYRYMRASSPFLTYISGRRIILEHKLLKPE